MKFARDALHPTVAGGRAGRRAAIFAFVIAPIVVGLGAAAPSAKRPASPSRLYAPTSPFNRPIPARAAVDPNSNAMIERLLADIAVKGWVVSSRSYTVPVFYANARTPRRSVRVEILNRVVRGVPIPDHAFPAPGSDAHMAVIDRARGCEYDFYRSARTGDGQWQAGLLNALPIKSSGVYPRGSGARASGFANAAGLILATELRAGVIPHALVFTMRHTKAGGPVAPATSSDGRSNEPGAIPEGARLQLDPALDIDSLPLARWQKVIARTLQRYGMYLGDTGGSVALFAQHAGTTRYRYPWGDLRYAAMPASLARYLRVLKLPPQRRVKQEFVRTRCLDVR